MPTDQPQPPAETLLAQLLSREPIFHRPVAAATLEDFDAMLSPDFWEVGASGRRYDRAFILQHLALNQPVDAAMAGWQVVDPEIRSLGPNTSLLTYTLHQGPRLSRRATVWRNTPSGWQVLYHQGTLLAANSGDSPAPTVI